MALLTQNDVNAIEVELKAKRSEVENISAEIASKEKDVEKLESDTEELNSELEAKTEELRLLNRTVEDSENKVIASEEEIQAIDAEKKDIEAEIDASEDEEEVASLKKEVERLDSLQAELQDKIAEAKDQGKEAADEASNMSDDVEKLSDEIAARVSERESVESEIEEETDKLNNAAERVTELENDDTLARFNEETAERRTHARSTFEDVERIKPLLINSNEGLTAVISERTSDSSVFISDIKAELGVNSTAEDLMKSQVTKLHQDKAEILNASEAFQTSRTSLFDIEIAGIASKIKNACELGKTTLTINQNQITGMHILALNEMGYKVTHGSVISENGKKVATVTIDWGFAASEG